jgi:hypothetical protein
VFAHGGWVNLVNLGLWTMVKDGEGEYGLISGWGGDRMGRWLSCWRICGGIMYCRRRGWR